MRWVAIVKWLLLVAGVGGAVAWLAVGPAAARADLYVPALLVIAGAAGFAAAIDLDVAAATGHRLSGGRVLSAVLTLIMLTAILGLMAVPAAWGVELWVGDWTPLAASLLMTLPAALIALAIAVGVWQQSQIKRAQVALAIAPSAEVASGLAERARSWHLTHRLDACQTLLDAGYPAHVDRLLTAKDDPINPMQATERVYQLVIARAALGDPTRASHALTELPSPLPRAGRRLADLSRARVALACGDPDGALGFLDAPVEHRPKRRHRAQLATTERALRAQAHAERGEPELARRELAALRELAGDQVLEVLTRGDGAVAQLAAEMIHGGTGGAYR